MNTRLQSIVNSQNEKIESLTSQVHEIATTVQSLKVIINELPKSLETMLANSLKSQGKRPLTDFDTGSSSVTGDNNNTLFLLPKVKLPLFDGHDARGWMSKAKLYFQVHNTPPNSRLTLAQMCMDGTALPWFTNLLSKYPHTNWAHFKSKLMVRFFGTIFHNVYEAIGSLFQEGLVDDYIDEFESLLALIPDQIEEQSIGMFLRGLRDDIRNWVRTLNPTTCSQAMDLARNVEMALGGQPTGLYTKGRLAHTGRTNLSPGTIFNSSTRFLLASNGQKTTPSLPTSGTRHLTKQEWEDRRKKGLCFSCGQKYSPQHICQEGGLRVMLLADGDMVTDDGEVYNLEAVT